MADIKFKFSDEELESILNTAQESGSGYWARTDRDIPDVLKGEPVRFWDAEEVKYIRGEDGSRQIDPKCEVIGTLTRDKLEAAGEVLAKKIRRDLVAQFIEDPAGADADASDAFLQVALFGEIVYA
jgi:hypothetical protein